MNVQLTLEDLPQDRANCGNCTRKGGSCARTKSDKTIHNGNIYNHGEVSGVIYKCVHYTGKYAKEDR